jgi:hypothetical protein
MHRLPVFVTVSLVASTLAMTLAGCHRTVNSSRVPPAVLEVLDNIYETSSGVLHNPSVDVRVQQAGAVEITLRGQVLSKPEAEGDVWIPVLLAPKLPPYFQIVAPNDSPGIALRHTNSRKGCGASQRSCSGPLALLFPHNTVEFFRPSPATTASHPSSLFPRRSEAKLIRSGLSTRGLSRPAVLHCQMKPPLLHPSL